MELSGARVTVVTVEMELFAKVYKCYSFLKLKFEDNLEIGFSPPRQAVTKNISLFKLDKTRHKSLFTR